MANDVSCDESARSLAVRSVDPVGRASLVNGKSLGIGLPPGYQRLSNLLTQPVLGGFERRRELRAPGADRPQALGQPRPGPRLYLEVASRGLATDRLQVLEPGVCFLDQQQLESLLRAREGHADHLRFVAESLGPRPDGAVVGQAGVEVADGRLADGH